jgi:hypothetical protein
MAPHLYQLHFRRVVVILGIKLHAGRFVPKRHMRRPIDSMAIGEAALGGALLGNEPPIPTIGADFPLTPLWCEVVQHNRAVLYTGMA